MDVDIAQLIREVEIRPALWDQRSLYHNNRDVVHHLWAEVAFACGIPVEVTRTKWKSLRDNYRQEIRKLQRGKYGDPSLSPTRHKSTWVWYQRLMFLKSQVPPYCERLPTTVGDRVIPNFDRVLPMCERVPPVGETAFSPSSDQVTQLTPQIVKTETLYYDINSVCDTVLEEPAENWEPSDNSVMRNNLHRFFRPLQNSLVQNQFSSSTGGPSKTLARRVKKPRKKGRDETHMYLMSLLTPLSCLPKDRQLYVLNRIKELILEQTEENNFKSEKQAD